MPPSLTATRRQLASGLATMGFLHAVANGLGFLVGILMTRAIGPAGKGAYELAHSLGSSGSFFCAFGLPLAGSLAVARRQRLLAPLFGNALLFGGAIAVVAALFGVAARHLFLDRLGLSPWLFVGGLAWIPLSLTHRLLNFLLLGLLRYRAYNAVELLGRFATLALIAVLFVIGKLTATLALAAMALGFAARITVALTVLFAIARPRLSLPLFRRCFLFSWRTYLCDLLMATLFDVDLFFVALYLGKQAAGIYAVALSLLNVMAGLAEASHRFLFPLLTKAAGERGNWRTTKQMATLASLTLAVAIAATFPLWRPVLRWAYGEAFGAAAGPAAIIALAGIAYCWIALSTSYLLSLGFPSINLAFRGAALAVNSVLAFFFTQHNAPLTTVASIKALSYLALAVALALYLERVTRRSDASPASSTRDRKRTGSRPLFASQPA